MSISLSDTVSETVQSAIEIASGVAMVDMLLGSSSSTGTEQEPIVPVIHAPRVPLTPEEVERQKGLDILQHEQNMAEIASRERREIQESRNNKLYMVCGAVFVLIMMFFAR